MFEKPKHLSTVASEAFDRVQEELSATGINGVGVEVVERYAVTFALWYECQARVRSEGMSWGDGSRNTRMIDLHKLNSAVASLRREMGLGVTVEQAVESQSDTVDADDGGSSGLSLRYNFSNRN
jgi:phage terminase small subunit